MALDLDLEVNNKLALSFNKQFLEKINEIVKYLSDHKTDVSIEHKTFGLFEKFDICSGKIKVDDKSLLDVSDKIETSLYTRRLNELIKQNISKEVENLNVPYLFLKNTKLNEFPNLKKLRINGGVCNLDKSELDRLLNGNNISLISGNMLRINDNIKEDSIVIGGINCIAKYKDVVIKSEDYRSNDLKHVYNKDVYKNLDEILKFVLSEDNQFDSLILDDDLNNTLGRNVTIEYIAKKLIIRRQ